MLTLEDVLVFEQRDLMLCLQEATLLRLRLPMNVLFEMS